MVEQRDINVNLRTNLTEVRPDSREAVFVNLDTQEKTVYPVNIILILFDKLILIKI